MEVGGIAADARGAARIGQIGLEIARRLVDRVVLVSDEAIVEAQRRLWDHCRVLAEPGGAASLAGLISGAYRAEPEERVVALICGGNTDPASLARSG